MRNKHILNIPISKTLADIFMLQDNLPLMDRTSMLILLTFIMSMGQRVGTIIVTEEVLVVEQCIIIIRLLVPLREAL